MSAILILFPKKIPAIKKNPSTIDFQPLQYSFNSFKGKAVLSCIQLQQVIKPHSKAIGLYR